MVKCMGSKLRSLSDWIVTMAMHDMKKARPAIPSREKYEFTITLPDGTVRNFVCGAGIVGIKETSHGPTQRTLYP